MDIKSLFHGNYAATLRSTLLLFVILSATSFIVLPVTADPVAAGPVPVVSYEEEYARYLRDIQTALTKHGYNTGPVDGVAGPRTHNAIQNFKADNNLGIPEDPADLLGVKKTASCHWLLGQLRCPEDCTTSLVITRDDGLQSFSINCPGFDKTLVEKVPIGKVETVPEDTLVISRN